MDVSTRCSLVFANCIIDLILELFRIRHLLLVLRQLEGDLTLNVVKVERLDAVTGVLGDVDGYRLPVLQLNANLKECYQSVLGHHVSDIALNTLHLKTLQRTQLRQIVEVLLK